MNTILEELVARENFELCVFGFVKYKFKNHEGMSEVGSIEVARMLLGRNYFVLLPWHLATSGVGLAVLNCTMFSRKVYYYEIHFPHTDFPDSYQFENYLSEKAVRTQP